MSHAVFQGTIIRNEPAFRPRPFEIPGYHKFTVGRFEAFVAKSALDHIAQAARLAAPNEMIGFLVGRPFRDAHGPYVVVTSALVATSARCGPVTAETSLDDERNLLDRLLADHPVAEKIGWFHSHPFFQPFYSPTDLENQRFWSEPFHVGLLACLDRGAHSIRIFAFRGPESEPLAPPYAIAETHVAHAPAFREVPPMEQREPTVYEPQRTDQSIRRRSSLALLTFVLGIVWPIVYLLGIWMLIDALREGTIYTPAVFRVEKALSVSEPFAPQNTHEPTSLDR